MSHIGTREIAASAVMAALVCVTTMLIQVPIPATEGFFNVGDAMIIVAALTFGPMVGAIAGGIGSSLADLLGGWYIYVIPTLIIKGVEGLLAGWIMSRTDKLSFQRLMFAWIVGGLEMVGDISFFKSTYTASAPLLWRFPSTSSRWLSEASWASLFLKL